MSVEIINIKGFFQMTGEFTVENKVQVKTYFSEHISAHSIVTVCLKNIRKIDESAIDVLKFMHRKASKKQTKLIVSGTNNPIINQAFKIFNISYIFKNDK